MEKNAKNNNGFTIIELIIAIMIVVVLMAVVIVNIQGYIKKSKDSVSKGEIQSLMITANSMADNFPSGKYDPSYFTCTTEKTWISIRTKDSTAVCGTNSTSGPMQYNNFCACFTELSKTPTTYFCQDSTGAVTEQTVANCANECNLSGNALCGQN